MSDFAVEFRRVSKAFSDTIPVLSDFDLSIQRGDFLVLLGRSGSGKTTLLRLINRLVKADSGEVLVDGKSVLDWDPIRLRRRAGYVIQDVGLLPHYTVAENVELLPRLEGWSEQRRRRRSGELLDLVGLDLDEHGDKRPSQLSGGQRQRVGVARALAIDPPMLLMDEPFGALDPITRRKLQQEFKELASSLGKTIVFVTHDVAEAFQLAARVAVLDGGRLLQVGSPREIWEHPASSFVEEFVRLDSPEAVLG